MSLLIKDVTDKLEAVIPISLQQDWDNSGYQIKFGSEKSSGIVVSLDLTYECFKIAVKKKANLILTHHPLFFHPIKYIDFDKSSANVIASLVKENISVYSLHTNLDSSRFSMSRFILEKLHARDIIPLVPGKSRLYKLSVFIPKGYVGKVRDALFSVANPIIGNYENCSFETRGRGTFRPIGDANPFIGKTGKTEFVDESRLELLIGEDKLKAAVKILREAHPYEEVAFDIYPLFDTGDGNEEGDGAVGELESPVKFGDFLDLIHETINPVYINYTGDKEREIKRIGVVSGSGFSYIGNAVNTGCDVFISSELSHSKALKSYEDNICLVDLSHYDTEKYFTGIMKNVLEGWFDIPVFQNCKEAGAWHNPDCPIFSYKK